MSSNVAIKINKLSKSYTISRQRGVRATNFAEALVSSIRNPFTRSDSETFWALKEINLEVNKSEVVGIIGRNGAGKSTLLKVLSRITEPTTGRIELYGRVGSLLEVGTGFHPELTGRENIFLNGAILGMRKNDIRTQFEGIVDFAGIDKFLDTPVKRYSSGMYVRLAFAVAAHLNPEILIIDEVLAVGDADFQNKCLGKMQEVAKSGRTVLFVSHSMLAVQKLCTSGVLMEKGTIRSFGTIKEIVDEYCQIGHSAEYSCMPRSDLPTITSVTIQPKNPRSNEQLDITVNWSMPRTCSGIKVGIGINTLEGIRIFDSAPEDYGHITPCKIGNNSGVFSIPMNSLLARSYVISVGLWDNRQVFDHASSAVTFSVEAAPTGRYLHQNNSDALVSLPGIWQFG